MKGTSGPALTPVHVLTTLDIERSWKGMFTPAGGSQLPRQALLTAEPPDRRKQSLATTPDGFNPFGVAIPLLRGGRVVTAVAEKRDPTGFGGRLRDLRIAKGLTQEGLGELAGMRYQAIARLERGDRTPSWDTVLKLAKALGVEANAFQVPGAVTTSTDDKPPPPKRPRKK